MKPEKIYNKMCPCGCFDLIQDQEIDFIKEFKHWFLALNHRQGFLGKCLLILKAHKTDEIEMTDEEILEKHKIYCLWWKAVDKSFKPDKINQAQLGNEEYVHKGHLHCHFVPRYRRPIEFEGVKFQSDTPETQKLSYSRLPKSIIHPLKIRRRIKEELLRYL